MIGAEKSLPQAETIRTHVNSLPINESGIWTYFGYGSSFTGITVTSSFSCFAAELPASAVFVLPIGATIFFLLVDDEVLALAFAEAIPAMIAAGLPG